MDTFFPGNPMTNIVNARITNIHFEGRSAYVTVSYSDCQVCNARKNTLVLIIKENTLLFNENGNFIFPRSLKVGMYINATVSSAMTRSNPPQSFAYIVRIIRR